MVKPVLALAVIAPLLGASVLPAVAGGSVATASGETPVAEWQDFAVGDVLDDERVRLDAVTATSAIEAEALATMRRADTFGSSGEGPVRWPFPAGVPITDRYGPRIAPCAGCSTLHKGLDLTPGEGVPIQAIAAGRVVRASSSGGFGVQAVIEHVVDGRRYRSLYAHMRPGSLALAEGQRVAAGDLVGRVGNSGQSTGPHLHLEISISGRKIDPFAWLSEQTT